MSETAVLSGWFDRPALAERYWLLAFDSAGLRGYQLGESLPSWLIRNVPESAVASEQAPDVVLPYQRITRVEIRRRRLVWLGSLRLHLEDGSEWQLYTRRWNLNLKEQAAQLRRLLPSGCGLTCPGDWRERHASR